MVRRSRLRGYSFTSRKNTNSKPGRGLSSTTVLLKLKTLVKPGWSKRASSSLARNHRWYSNHSCSLLSSKTDIRSQKANQVRDSSSSRSFTGPKPFTHLLLSRTQNVCLFRFFGCSYLVLLSQKKLFYLHYLNHLKFLHLLFINLHPSLSMVLRIWALQKTLLA